MMTKFTTIISGRKNKTCGTSKICVGFFCWKTWANLEAIHFWESKIAPQKLPEIQNIETADVVEETKQMFKYYLRCIVIKTTTELSNFILLNIGKPII